MGVLTAVYMQSTVEFARTLDSGQEFGIADGVCIAHHLGEQVHHPEIPVHATVRCGFYGISIGRSLNGYGIKKNTQLTCSLLSKNRKQVS